jgi:hypothetical protein
MSPVTATVGRPAALRGEPPAGAAHGDVRLTRPEALSEVAGMTQTRVATGDLAWCATCQMLPTDDPAIRCLTPAQALAEAMQVDPAPRGDRAEVALTGRAPMRRDRWAARALAT